jgi:DNA adenine methylase
VSGPCSPLRYPGGKQVLADALCDLIRANGLEGKTYLEPYAGGAGAALSLLFSEYVGRIRINDADPAIYSFWHSILVSKDRFLSKLRSIPLSVDEWLRQREIYQTQRHTPSLKLGFAAFYLNRCNRSGIIANAGIIGGLQQVGDWKLDARFNKAELEQRINKISLYRDRIEISNFDAIDFLDICANKKDVRSDSFVYLDPPYFGKGRQLYMNYYSVDDHLKLSKYLKKRAAFSWALTYDDAPDIRSLYSDLRIMPFNLRYSASESRTGSEILITKKDLIIPASWNNQVRLAS